ncbi:MAG: GTPase ObgE [Acidobacteriota bacterium]
MAFIDEVKIEIIAGDGGNGCIAFRREKFEPKGGPAGGDGGNGGSVYLVGRGHLNTLFHLRHRPVLKAKRGRHGEGSNCTGRRGDDLDIEVPLGTLVFDFESGSPMAEVLEDGERVLAAQGGRGGKGNARFATPTRRAPRYAEEGSPGERQLLKLELKLLADVGLVGLPNAGKSTLISTLSAAKPKIASYPFTTLAPQLGVVAGGVLDDPYVIADLPGLIRGAADGAGLGHQFLRHVERCRVLAHLVDLSGGDAAYGVVSEDAGEAPTDPAADAVAELVTIEQELEAFDPALLRRDRVIVGSKLDAALPERAEAVRAAAEERGLRYLEVSSATRVGLGELRALLDRMLQEAKAQEATEAQEAAEAQEDAPGPDGAESGGTAEEPTEGPAP